MTSIEALKAKIDETKDLLSVLNDSPKKIVVSFSHQSEDVVIIDILRRLKIDFTIFTLDTHKLFDESLNYQKCIENFFGVTIDSFSADPLLIACLEKMLGERGIYENIEFRKECCRVRKILPLHNALKGKDIWINGIRSEQSVTRSKKGVFEKDRATNVLKVSPLLEWSMDDIGQYMRMFGLPSNDLYSKGFTSIGCEPCTRAIEEGEHERAGRWWWEDPEHKECGLHRGGK